MAKKLGFALGAGGSRGVAHIGFLQAMEEAGIRPDYVCGTSMGSVVGSCYALGMSPEKMKEEITKLKFSEIFDLSLNPLGNGALLSAKKMYKKLQQYLGDITFDKLKIPFGCVAVDLNSGNTILFKDNQKVVDGVAASSSIPGVFRPLYLDDMVLVDGGIKCRVPVDEVRSMGADVVVAVDVLGGLRPCEKKYNMFTVIFRMADITDSELTAYKRKRQKYNLYLQPDLGNMSQYKFKNMDTAMEIGYELGKKSVNKILRLIER